MTWKVINNYFPSQIINQILRHLRNTKGFPHYVYTYFYTVSSVCCREASKEDSHAHSLSVGFGFFYSLTKAFYLRLQVTETRCVGDLFVACERYWLGKKRDRDCMYRETKKKELHVGKLYVSGSSSRLLSYRLVVLNRWVTSSTQIWLPD